MESCDDRLFPNNKFPNAKSGRHGKVCRLNLGGTGTREERASFYILPAHSSFKQAAEDQPRVYGKALTGLVPNPPACRPAGEPVQFAIASRPFHMEITSSAVTSSPGER